MINAKQIYAVLVWELGFNNSESMHCGSYDQRTLQVYTYKMTILWVWKRWYTCMSDAHRSSVEFAMWYSSPYKSGLPVKIVYNVVFAHWGELIISLYLKLSIISREFWQPGIKSGNQHKNSWIFLVLIAIILV